MARPYSHSALDNFRGCPRRYSFRYVERAEVSHVVTADNYLGNAVHRALAQLYSEAARGTLIPREAILDSYLREWQKPGKAAIVVKSEHGTVDAYIERGRKMLLQYYDKYQPFSEGKLLGCEMPITFRLKDTPFEFTARIDRLFKYDDGRIEICDYKSGLSLPQGGQDPRFFRQMGLYQLAVIEKFPHFERIELVQHFLAFDEIIRYTMSDDELDMIREEIRTTVVAIKEAIRLEQFEANEGGHCGYCDFQNLCPAKRHRLQLAVESGDNGEERTTAEYASELADNYIVLSHELATMESEKKALQESMIRAVRDLGVERLFGKEGSVKIALKNEEKFITRTKDSELFAELSATARRLGLEDYFELNARALMKEVYRKQTLSSEQLKQLGTFVLSVETSRISVSRNQKPDEE